MFPLGIEGAGRAIAAAVTLGALLAGCSDMYLDRRDAIALGAGDAVAANEVEEMVDPWPQHSNDQNLTFDGQRMQRAVECYRNNKVTPPDDINPTRDTAAPPSATAACAGQMSSGSAPPANGVSIGDTSTASNK